MMNRRNFILNTTLGLLSSQLLMACEEEIIDVQGKKSVLIVGAGMAGLAAARKLKQNGFAVTVIESQERVGGRIRTNREFGLPFDEGASWIHGIKGNPLVELASQAGASTVKTIDTITAYDVDGKKYSDDEVADAEEKFYRILETLMRKGDSKKNFEEVYKTLYPELQNDRLYQFFVSTYLTFDTGDQSLLSSTLYYEGELYDDDEMLMTNGYDFLPKYLAKDIDIKLNESVSKIDYSTTAVNIATNKSTYTADYVLVTVPLGVLKKGIVSFQPALPSKKQTAIEAVGMNVVNKFLLSWEKKFWDDTLFLAYTPNVKDKFNYFVNFNSLNPKANALLTFAYSDAARATESQSDSQVIDQIMAHLQAMYGNSIPQPLTFQRTKWASNPYTFGAYSFTKVGMQMNQFDELAESISDKVFFAGEHTHRDYFSTAHGAYLSGLREADKLIGLQ